MDPDAPNLELLEPPAPVQLLPDHSLWLWALAAAGALALLGLAIWYFKRRNRPTFNPKAHVIEAYRIAKTNLERLDQSDPRKCATAASLVLREYLASAARDPSLFETHEEFLHRNNALQALTDDARESAKATFSELASIKYGPDRLDVPTGRIAATSLDLLETLHQGLLA